MTKDRNLKSALYNVACHQNQKDGCKAKTILDSIYHVRNLYAKSGFIKTAGLFIPR